MKAQSQASKQSWWVTNDAESVDPPKKPKEPKKPKKSKKGKKRRSKSGNSNPVQIKVNDLCFFIHELPARTQTRVVNALKGANVGGEARSMTLRELDGSSYFAPPGAQISIRPLLERLSQEDLVEFRKVTAPGAQYPADQPSLKSTAEVLQTQTLEAKGPQKQVGPHETSDEAQLLQAQVPLEPVSPIERERADKLVGEALRRFDK